MVAHADTASHTVMGIIACTEKRIVENCLPSSKSDICRATSSSSNTSSKNLNKTSKAVAEGKPKEAASRLSD